MTTKTKRAWNENILSHKDAKFSEHYLQSTQDWRGTCHQSWRTSQRFLSWSRSWRSSRWPFSSAGCSASWRMWSCWCWRRYKCWLTGRCDVRLVASLWAVGWILLELPTQHNVRPGRVTFSWHLPVTFTLSRIHETSLIINQGWGINMQWINHIMQRKSSEEFEAILYSTAHHPSFTTEIMFIKYSFFSPRLSSLKWRWSGDGDCENTHHHRQNSALCTSQKIRPLRVKQEPVMLRCHGAGERVWQRSGTTLQLPCWLYILQLLNHWARTLRILCSILYWYLLQVTTGG